MDALTISAHLVESVAWPSAIVLIVLLFRKELAALLRRVRRVKHNDSEIDFEEEVSAANEEAGRVADLPPKANLSSQDKALRLAVVSPRGAILSAWLGVEDGMKKFVASHGLGQEVGDRNLVQAIRMHNLDTPSLGKGVIEMIDKLRTLRNAAVHSTDTEITQAVASEYVELAERVKHRLEEA